MIHGNSLRLVVALKGAHVRTPETFRRLLRGCWAEGGDVVFQVRRSGKTLAVHVPLGK